MTNLFTLKARLIIGLIVFAIIVSMAVVTVSRIRATAFAQGVASCQAEATKALATANSENRTREADLEVEITQYAERLEEARAARRDRETVIVNRIEERLVEQANCQIDPEIVRLRNEVRAGE